MHYRRCRLSPSNVRVVVDIIELLRVGLPYAKIMARCELRISNAMVGSDKGNRRKKVHYVSLARARASRTYHADAVDVCAMLFLQTTNHSNISTEDDISHGVLNDETFGSCRVAMTGVMNREMVGCCSRIDYHPWRHAACQFEGSADGHESQGPPAYGRRDSELAPAVCT